MSDNIITFPGHINAEKLQYQIEDIRAQLAENFEEVTKYYIAARDLESKKQCTTKQIRQFSSQARC